MARQIVVDIIGDSKKYTKATEDAVKSTSRLDDSIAKFKKQGGIGQAILGGVGIGAGLGIFGAVTKGIGMVTDVIGDSISAASDQAEAMSKVTVVFEDQAKEIASWSRTAATSMGMSQTAALEAAGTLGNLFDGLGITNDAGLEMSKTITQLAADLGSFNNVATDEALLALRSGLLGEAEPMRKFGSALSAARVDAYGFANGLETVAQAAGSKVKPQLTEAAKVQARYALILEDTKNAQGDFARTSDGMANSQKTLTAKFEDFQVSLGRLLQGPAMGVLGFFDQLIDRLAPSGSSSLPPRVQNVIDKVKELNKVVSETPELIGTKSVVTLEDAAKALNEMTESMRLGGNSTVAKWLGMTGPEFTKIAMGAGLTAQNLASIAFEVQKAGGSFEQYRSAIIAAVNDTDNVTTSIVDSWRIAGRVVTTVTGDMAGDAEEAGKDIYGGLVTPTRRAFKAMFSTMEAQKSPWREAWKEMAAYAKDPFRPDAFERWLGKRADRAIEKAKQAAEDGKPGVARRWLALARVMKTPVLAALADTQEEIQALVTAMRTVMLLGSKTGTLRMGTKEKVAGRASGGPVKAGTPYIVGETRPELFVPDQNGTIVPSVPSMRSSAGTSNAYTINVNVAPGGDLVQTGRQIVEAIRQFERRSGAVWRSA